MRTYEVTIRPFGVKRVIEKYTIHASSRKTAESTALTQFLEENPESLNLGCRFKAEAKAI